MSYELYKYGFWCRLFGGRGFSIERDRPKLFSERQGIVRVYRLGRWSFKWFPK
jgi:hypothetical protein